VASDGIIRLQSVAHRTGLGTVGYDHCWEFSGFCVWRLRKALEELIAAGVGAELRTSYNTCK